MDLSTELSNNPEYVKRVNESVETLRSNFNEIKTFLDKPLSDVNFNSAFHGFKNIFNIIPLLTVSLSLPQIIRGRPHFPAELLCSERWQLSYNWRFRHKIPLGRFNQKGEPLFYGSLPTQSKEMDPILSCSLECCKELSIEYGAPNVQDITLGSWKIAQPFEVFILCFDNLHLSANPDLKESVYTYLKTIHDHFSADAANLIETILKYLSELSRTITDKNEAYRILAPLFVALQYYSIELYKRPVYGLIYPSAMTLAKGLNVVLTREAVKQFLRLDKVVMYRYFLVKPECTTWVADKCSDIIKVKSHKFKITNYIPPAKY